VPSSSLTRVVPRTLRALESAVHAAWLRATVALFAQDGGPLSGWDARPDRLLFIRYDRVGDMVLCTGVLRALARAYPGMLLDVLTTPGNAAVLSHLPFVDQVITHERSTVARVSRALPAPGRQALRRRHRRVGASAIGQFIYDVADPRLESALAYREPRAPPVRDERVLFHEFVKEVDAGTDRQRDRAASEPELQPVAAPLRPPRRLRERSRIRAEHPR
jgi:hypothetical protein